MGRSLDWLIHHSHGRDVVQFGKLVVEIGIPLCLNQALIGASSGGSTFAVGGIELRLRQFHALHDFSKGSKALTVQKGIVFGVEKDLSGSGIRTGRGKDDGAFGVGDLDGVIWEGFGTPLTLDGWITIDSELSDKAWQNAEEAAVLVKIVFRKFLLLKNR